MTEKRVATLCRRCRGAIYSDLIPETPRACCRATIRRLVRDNAVHYSGGNGGLHAVFGQRPCRRTNINLHMFSEFEDEVTCKACLQHHVPRERKKC